MLFFYMACFVFRALCICWLSFPHNQLEVVWERRISNDRFVLSEILTNSMMSANEHTDTHTHKITNARN